MENWKSQVLWSAIWRKDKAQVYWFSTRRQLFISKRCGEGRESDTTSETGGLEGEPLKAAGPLPQTRLIFNTLSPSPFQSSSQTTSQPLHCSAACLSSRLRAFVLKNKRPGYCRRDEFQNPLLCTQRQCKNARHLKSHVFFAAYLRMFHTKARRHEALIPCSLSPPALLLTAL